MVKMSVFESARHGLIKKLDTEKIEQAIAAAEQLTSGEIRVSVAPFFWGSIERAAKKAFERLGMHRTRERNAVLIFVVPSRRKFYVLGDAGIHARVGGEFWSSVVAAITPHFERGDFTEGLLRGIAILGERLAEVFPHRGAADENELPDRVD
jgi:uncharacterized membrane protein